MDRNDKIFVMKTLVATVFGCYEGKKDPQKLVEDPMSIEKEDFDDVALPPNILERPKRIILELIKELQ